MSQSSVEFEGPYDPRLPSSYGTEVVASASKSYRTRVLADIKLMEDVATVERHHIYRAQGFSSTAGWYATSFGCGFIRACEYVEVALAIDRLPKLKDAYLKGRLSYDHLRKLSEVIDEENFRELIEAAEGTTYAERYRMVERKKKLSSQDSVSARADRSLRMSWDDRTRMLWILGRFPEDQGTLLERAVNSLVGKIPEDPYFDAGPTPIDVKRADALVELVMGSAGARVHKPLLVVHVDEQTLLDKEEGVAYLEAGPTVCPETARRLACNALVRAVAKGKDGKLHALGKAHSTVSERLATEVIHRDDSRCQVSGCRKRLVFEIHHIRHRSDRGESTLENLVLLCPTHHSMVHEGGWKIGGKPPRIWLEHRWFPAIKAGPPFLTEEELSDVERQFESLSARARGPDP